MPLNKSCNQNAAHANYRELYKAGYRNPQLSAIVLSTLKKACGVKKDSKPMTAKKMIAVKNNESKQVFIQLGTDSVPSCWFDFDDLFEGLPSSPAIRGLWFNLPAGMRGVGTSINAAPPSDSRGLVGGVAPPVPLAKCPKCGRPYNKATKFCKNCGVV